MATRYDDRYSERYTPRYNYRYGLQVYVSGVVILGTIAATAIVGTPYSSSALSAAGAAVHSWTAVNLPPGLTINADTGVISGTPTAAGDFSNIIVQVEAVTGRTSSSTQAIVVGAVLALTGTLPNGVNLTAYTAAYTVTGGVAPFVWALASGSLPTGTTLGSTGVISGNLSATGTFNPVIRVTDAIAQTTTRTNAIVIS